MKILAIYPESASGISEIYQRIIFEMAKYATIDTITDVAPSPEQSCNGLRNQYHIPISERDKGWYRRFIRWFAATPVSNAWARKAESIAAKDYDIIIAFISSSELTPAIAGKYLAEQLGCKFAVYSVDAIPAPGGWEHGRYYRQKMRVVARTLTGADFVASSNKHMLAYQLTTFKHKEELRSGVIYTPSPNRRYINPISKEHVLLYTGSLYGLRNPLHLFKAFKRLLKEYPEARLLIVGAKLRLKSRDSIFTSEERKHVELHPHTNDLNPYFARARVLIDIDADREKDPFLSSKVVTYIKANRMIVSETGLDTPSRDMFKGMTTVVQCNHNSESLYNGLKQALELSATEQDYSEREALIELFSIESVCTQFMSYIKELVEH